MQNFGIAIGSTIAGIGLRVLFNQMRRDPVEVEQRSRLELAEAARRVRRELDSSVVEFAYFRRNAQQAAADSPSDVAEKFEKSASLSPPSANGALGATLEEGSRRSARPSRSMGGARAA